MLSNICICVKAKDRPTATLGAHLQEDAELLNEVLLGAPRVPAGQLQHGVTGQRAQQRRPAARPHQLHRGGVEGVQAPLELHAQHQLALPVLLFQPPQILCYSILNTAQHHHCCEVAPCKGESLSRGDLE